MELRQADGLETRERIDGYLQRSGLAARSPRVVPLTGDASDRRYFRVILPDAPSIVLALYSAAFDVQSLPFVNVATLLARMPVPVPSVFGHADDLGVLALQDLGDVTLQAHLGASRAEHAALYRQAVALIAEMQRRGEATRLAGVPAVRDRVRRREAVVGAGLLHEALPRGVQGRHARTGRRRCTAGGVRGARSRARV